MMDKTTKTGNEQELSFKHADLFIIFTHSSQTSLSHAQLDVCVLNQGCYDHKHVTASWVFLSEAKQLKISKYLNLSSFQFVDKTQTLTAGSRVLPRKPLLYSIYCL